MACFILPKSLCENLEHIVVRFWWKKDHEKQGIRWYEWEKLCEFKDNEGLGFQSFGRFNINLLAKGGGLLNILIHY